MTLLKADYATPQYDFILGYACASNNHTWAIKIARYMYGKGLSVPLSVYLYSDSEQLSEIEKIFHVVYQPFKLPST